MERSLKMEIGDGKEYVWKSGKIHVPGSSVHKQTKHK